MEPAGINVPEQRALWEGVDRLVASADESALRLHGVHLLASRALRAHGRPVPPQLSAELRSAAVLTLLASELLERVRAAVDGPLMLIKGLEVASLYPEPSLRPFADVDLLAAHPDAGVPGAARRRVRAHRAP